MINSLFGWKLWNVVLATISMYFFLWWFRWLVLHIYIFLSIELFWSFFLKLLCVNKQIQWNFCFCLLFYVLFVAMKWNAIANWKQHNVATCYPTTCVYSTTCQRICYGSIYILYVPTMLKTMSWNACNECN